MFISYISTISISPELSLCYTVMPPKGSMELGHTLECRSISGPFIAVSCGSGLSFMSLSTNWKCQFRSPSPGLTSHYFCGLNFA